MFKSDLKDRGQPVPDGKDRGRWRKKAGNSSITHTEQTGRVHNEIERANRVDSLPAQSHPRWQVFCTVMHCTGEAAPLRVGGTNTGGHDALEPQLENVKTERDSLQLSKIGRRDRWFEIARINSANTKSDAAIDIDGAIGTIRCFAKLGAGLGRQSNNFPVSKIRSIAGCRHRRQTPDFNVCRVVVRPPKRRGVSGGLVSD